MIVCTSTEYQKHLSLNNPAPQFLESGSLAWAILKYHGFAVSGVITSLFTVHILSGANYSIEIAPSLMAQSFPSPLGRNHEVFAGPRGYDIGTGVASGCSASQLDSTTQLMQYQHRPMSPTFCDAIYTPGRQRIQLKPSNLSAFSPDCSRGIEYTSARPKSKIFGPILGNNLESPASSIPNWSIRTATLQHCALSDILDSLDGSGISVHISGDQHQIRGMLSPEITIDDATILDSEDTITPASCNQQLNTQNLQAP